MLHSCHTRLPTTAGWVQDAPLRCEPLSRLGPDVYTAPLPLDEWVAALQKRSARAAALKIKALLLEQVRGRTGLHDLCLAWV